ncbi:MAG: formate dehydrogenase major subunit [Actinomycetota bacterium]|nr:formate dehydrogenase major subunit [Actinomycetota bacterium]
MGASFGRGGATTFQQDLANADCILIMGSNMAECHPVGFQWVMEAKLRGATIIHVDPRFSRTSAVADVFVPLRAGSDIAFLGAVINHILQNGREFREYVTAYTNASAILSEDYRDTEDLDGLFSGWDPESKSYDNSSWQYAGLEPAGRTGRLEREASQGQQHGAHGAPHGGKPPETDPTLQHPRCVFQVLKRHYARYTPEMVEEVCGVPPEQFLAVAEALCRNSGRERTTAFCYAVGWTQHTVGAQYIRTAAIIQLLLGNIGRPGGGIMALRGHASIQGSTDIPTLYDLLPGYLAMPHAGLHPDLESYVAARSKREGAWANVDAYLISLLKAWWGDHATADNDFCFDHVPRITGDHSAYHTMLAMLDGMVKGYFLFGQNPAVGSPNSRMHRLALAQLDWLVVRDLVEIESATYWLDGPEIETGELAATAIGTEVFFLPAAAHTEKDGTFTNTQRLLQWHHKAVEPPGDCRSDLWFAYHLGRIIREKLADSTDPRDLPLLQLTWDYPVEGPTADPSADAVLREINGFHGDGRPLSASTELTADGTTTCGCWIYCGSYADGVNQTARRRPGSEQDWVAAEWAWAWPANRRMLYNRASADPDGKPWSERKKYLWWDEGAGRWTGPDVPDFPPTTRPDYRPPEGATGLADVAGTDPFTMQGDGLGWLFAPTGLLDGPLPTHYEPHESPIVNPLYGQQANPARKEIHRRGNRANPTAGRPGADVFPYVVTTYRLTEHHTAGGMSRFLAYLSELQPAPLCEVGPELAAERGLVNGEWATVITARSAIEARVLVTDRMPALSSGGRRIHQVGLPYHWGTKGLVTGDSTNDLLGLALDPNVVIQESKAGTCDVRPGRRPRGPALPRLVAEYRQRAGLEGDLDA